MTDAVSFRFAIEKADKTGRFVSGWFSVIEKDGNPICDTQGDVVSMDDTTEGGGLRSAAHGFVKNARAAKAMHDGNSVGDCVESVLIDDEFAKAHAITHTKRGWWGTMEIHNEEVRKRVRSGELKAFSIGGRGKRTAIAKSGPTADSVHSDRVLGGRGKPKFSGARVRFELAARRLKRAFASAR